MSFAIAAFNPSNGSLLFAERSAIAHAVKPTVDVVARVATGSVQFEEPTRISSVPLACRHGRMSTDRKRPRPKIAPRRQVARP
jgi:hypothetical protein